MSRTRPDLLLVDDDTAFLRTQARMLRLRGLEVRTAETAAEALQRAHEEGADNCVVDLRLGEALGIDLLEPLRQCLPDTRIIMLTGYASIATAVHAIKLGADDYIAKPITADELLARLRCTAPEAQPEAGPETAPSALKPMSLKRLEWEHIQRVLDECGGNVSSAAERLGLHRRTLQRKLGKRPVRD